MLVNFLTEKLVFVLAVPEGGHEPEAVAAAIEEDILC